MRQHQTGPSRERVGFVNLALRDGTVLAHETPHALCCEMAHFTQRPRIDLCDITKPSQCSNIHSRALHTWGDWALILQPPRVSLKLNIVRREFRDLWVCLLPVACRDVFVRLARAGEGCLAYRRSSSTKLPQSVQDEGFSAGELRKGRKPLGRIAS